MSFSNRCFPTKGEGRCALLSCVAQRSAACVPADGWSPCTFAVWLRSSNFPVPMLLCLLCAALPAAQPSRSGPPPATWTTSGSWVSMLSCPSASCERLRDMDPWPSLTITQSSMPCTVPLLPDKTNPMATNIGFVPLLAGCRVVLPLLGARRLDPPRSQGHHPGTQHVWAAG